jgi:hypothetical protein
MQQQRVFPKSTVLLAQLIVWLHTFGLQVNPCPVDTEENRYNGWEVQVEKGLA